MENWKTKVKGIKENLKKWRDFVCMDQKTQYCHDVSSCQRDTNPLGTPVKIAARYLLDGGKCILNVCDERKVLQQQTQLKEKDNIEGLTTSTARYHRTTVIRRAWYWRREWTNGAEYRVQRQAPGIAD